MLMGTSNGCSEMPIVGSERKWPYDLGDVSEFSSFGLLDSRCSSISPKSSPVSSAGHRSSASSVEYGIDMLIQMAERALNMHEENPDNSFSYIQSSPERHSRMTHQEPLESANSSVWSPMFSDISIPSAKWQCSELKDSPTAESWFNSAPGSITKPANNDIRRMDHPNPSMLNPFLSVHNHFLSQSPFPQLNPQNPQHPATQRQRKRNLKRSMMLTNLASAHRMAAINNRDKEVLTWQGRLMYRCYNSTSRFSHKLFVGGVPWECTQSQLLATFSLYGACRIEAPSGGSTALANRHRNNHHHQYCSDPGQQTFPGFVYVVYEKELSVISILRQCYRDKCNRFFYTVPIESRRNAQAKRVQIIPWDQRDSAFIASSMIYGNDQVLPYDTGHQMPPCLDFQHFQCTSRRESMSSVGSMCHDYMAMTGDVRRTVFVGALHGMITAHTLYRIMTDLFGPVESVRLDTDKQRYPIGSGRVTFVRREGYERAIKAEFVKVVADRFDRILQIDPYLYSEPCCICHRFEDSSDIDVHPITLAFCRSCLSYYCADCWYDYHSNIASEATDDTVDAYRPTIATCRKHSSLMNTSSSLRDHDCKSPSACSSSSTTPRNGHHNLLHVKGHRRHTLHTATAMSNGGNAYRCTFDDANENVAFNLNSEHVPLMRISRLSVPTLLC